jgi:hypothetical protein
MPAVLPYTLDEPSRSLTSRVNRSLGLPRKRMKMSNRSPSPTGQDHSLTTSTTLLRALRQIKEKSVKVLMPSELSSMISTHLPPALLRPSSDHQGCPRDRLRGIPSRVPPLFRLRQIAVRLFQHLSPGGPNQKSSLSMTLMTKIQRSQILTTIFPISTAWSDQTRGSSCPSHLSPY